MSPCDRVAPGNGFLFVDLYDLRGYGGDVLLTHLHTVK
jgi:hypothetical protein